MAEEKKVVKKVAPKKTATKKSTVSVTLVKSFYGYKTYDNIQDKKHNHANFYTGALTETHQ